PLLRPPRLDRLECRAAAAGPPRRAAEPGRPRAGASLRRDSARALRARRPRPAGPRLRVEPARAGERDHGIDARSARLAAGRLSDPPPAPRTPVRRAGRA